MNDRLKRGLAAALCALPLLCGMAPACRAAGTGTEQTTLYGVGSISKIFTTAAVLRLAEEGRLDLDAPLTDYLPEFIMADQRCRLITPRMLLDHSSGLQGSCYRNTILLGDNDSFAHDTLLEQLKTQRLKANPGAFSVYCNDGFTLAELLVERVSGQSFTDYLREKFWAPMGLRHMQTPQSLFDRGLLAPIYWDGKAQLPPESANIIGSGGIYATAEDLCRFARLFTRGSDGSLLSAESARRMEEPAYAGGAWTGSPPSGAAMAYGLGWDSVNAYPCGAYGVQALSKGGDTTAYHGSLIVLPQEDITCAVLSSGGSSGFCQAAAQDILLEYLREIGRLPEDGQPAPEDPAPDLSPSEPVPGWYASRQQAIYVETAGDGLTLRSAGTDRDATQRYDRDGDVFRSAEGAYISPEGRLVEAENGVKGSTTLSFGTDENRTVYLLIDTRETLPGLGETRNSVPFAQYVEASPLPANTAGLWEGRAGTRYYVVNETYTSSSYLSDPSMLPRLIEGLPGYFSLGESGPTPSLTRIADGSSARFFQTIPGQAGRDLLDIRFFREDGVEKLDTQNHILIPEEAVTPLGDRQSVAVGPDGQTVWCSADADGSRQAVLTAPENGSFFIYRLDTDGLTCTASSLTGKSGVALYLPENCRIAFAGEPGAAFTIRWVSP